MTTERFATLIGCIDGRAQTRTLDQVALRFGIKNIDNITRPGAVRYLTEAGDPVGESILRDLSVSVSNHDSSQLAIVAHSSCAGNPVPDRRQKEQLGSARELVRHSFPDLEVTALFLDLKTGFEQIR